MARATRASLAKASSDAAPQQLSSPPSTPDPVKSKKAASRSKAKAKASPQVKQEPKSTPANTSKKRARKAIKEEVEDDDLPHNLGTTLPSPGAEEDIDQAPPKKRTRRSGPIKEEPSVKQEAEDEPSPAKKTPKKAKLALKHGISPFPDYERPTREECEEVVRILEKKHGKVSVPKAIPPPSLDVAGCGEVPSVLDALIRTRLSANTTNSNSSTAFRGLVSRFGTLKEGIGKGSVDWNAVRLAPQQEVFKAIERGGLANVKSKDIKNILQMVYEENQERRAELAKSSDDVIGAQNESEDDKQDEINKADQDIISLDHLHLMSTNDAIDKMITYPGIGAKTASCVALFCLQRPSFAVDTHVFRLVQYLGWVPKSTKKGQPKVDRNTTYSHCDARIPNEFKYKLHYLLIKHGKTCPRCRAATGQSSEGWEAGCPIEHLVKRHGEKKGGVSVAARKKAKQDAIDGDDDAVDDAPESPEERLESPELSDHPSDVE
ncbi:Putative HhH-GPD domain, DNA glycosylase [Septoria linicola]|uniref:HhH-GPD domain, DNA glycosylase n=1 Tax=Septoria linicola TaxID=215465 RepID=A0A9Q9ACW1_9PEZI|nr:putative HhH-GPD domain, DNA glycosylase [Septoria linicola]USW47224.1 Putative HhH-GPD domain, DNA glycosylase [Septoria linicola]